MANRQSRILEYVIENGRVDVVDLAAMMAVSQVTIRKDLDKLEKSGLLQREHGFAVAAPHDNMLSRLAYHHAVKRRIAVAAAETVADGDTIMIESGSSCALLADEVARNRRGVTIITNSAFIADYVRKTSAHVVLLGGTYQAESQVLVGPLVALTAANFFVDKLFVGIDGYTEESGFTAKDFDRAVAVRAMADQAQELIVLTESLKFPRLGAVKVVEASAVAKVFTDELLPKPIQSQLTAAGVTVYKV